jgi:hypothetical protein
MQVFEKNADLWGASVTVPLKAPLAAGDAAVD